METLLRSIRAVLHLPVHHAVGIALVASSASSQQLTPGASEAAATAALAVLGIAATPNDTLTSFSFLNASGGSSDFLSTQIHGGFNLADAPAIYLEGLAAYQIYNPVKVFSGIVPDTALDVTWTSAAGTAGVGYEFPLRLGWTLRPMVHLSLGYVSTDAFLNRLPIVPLNGNAASDVEGGLWSGGFGGSLGLLNEVQIGEWAIEYRFRHSLMGFFPLDEPAAGNAWADAHQTTFFSRHRVPLPDIRFGQAPVKAVFDAGMVLYHGDGAQVLGTNWLGSMGAGFELDTKAAGTPVVSRARVMLNGVLGDGYRGFSLGLGVGF